MSGSRLLTLCVLSLWVSGAEGQSNLALWCNSANDSVAVPHSATLQNATEITIEAWVLPFGGPVGRVVSKGDTNAYVGFRSYNLNRYTDGSVRIAWFCGPQGTTNWVPTDSNPGTAPIGQWTHLAATFSSALGLSELYANGVLVGSRTTTSTAVSLTGLLLRDSSPFATHIGRGVPLSATFYPFAGLIDEVRIWSVALAASQIPILMHSQPASAPGLEAYWSMDGNAMDGTGNGHNGTVTGSATFGGVPFQTNQATASIDIDGVTGTALAFASNTLAVGQMGLMTFSSANTGQLWDLGIGTAALLPSNQGGVVLPDGQALNLDVTDPGLVLLWSNFLSPPFQNFAASVSFSVATAHSAQMAVYDPTSLSGWRLSQPIRLAVQ